MSVWSTVRLGEVIRHRKGSITIDDALTYKLCRVQLHRRGVVLREHRNGAEIRTKKQQVCRAGDFLVAEMDAKVGGYGFVPLGLDGAIVSSHYFLFELDETQLWPAFLEVISQAEILQGQIVAKGSTNYAAIRPASVLGWEIPLPPLAVQKRMAANFTRARAALAAAEQEIAHQETLVAKLKQAILQEAITGRLTAGWRAAQSDMEPASQLLARICVEKKRLVAVKKLRPEKSPPPIPEAGIPFAIPEGWEWCRLGSVISGTESGWSPACLKQQASEGKWGVLKTTAVQICEYLPHENKELPASLEPRPEHEVEVGDILMTRAGPANRVGICALVRATPPKLMISDKIVRFRPVLVKGEYLELFSNTPEFQKLIEASKQGMAQSQVNISQENLKATVLPLPPLREQTEIVARVERLIERCRELEAEIVRSRAHAAHLHQAVLREAFAPASAAVSAIDTRPALKALTYLLQFLPALARATGSRITLDQLNSATACLFLPKADLLPLVGEIAGSEARDHFARLDQPYEEGAFLAAVKTLLKTKTFIFDSDETNTSTFMLTGKLPPISPEIDTDARYLAPIVARIPAKTLARSAPRREKSPTRETILQLV
jgi:type I restriction enzyme, S subunit